MSRSIALCPGHYIKPTLESFMKSFLNTTASVLALVVVTTGNALADTNLLPEPGSFALAGIGIAAAVYFLRKGTRK